jgi:hypothetical protein
LVPNWQGSVARRSDGSLFGTLLTGGDVHLPMAVGSSLYEFTDGADDENPEGGLILDSAGNLYGTTTGSLGGIGSVFEIAPSLT